MSEEKYVVKSKNSELYYCGGCSFVDDVKKAKVFNSLDEIHPHFRNSSDEEIVELNSGRKKDKKFCFVKEKGRNSYYYGGASYGRDLFRGIHDYDELPDIVKKTYKSEIIFADSKEGIEIIVDEICKLHNEIKNTEPRLNEIKKGLNLLYSLPFIQIKMMVIE